jgi:hypothetical protein
MIERQRKMNTKYNCVLYLYRLKHAIIKTTYFKSWNRLYSLSWDANLLSPSFFPWVQIKLNSWVWKIISFWVEKTDCFYWTYALIYWCFKSSNVLNLFSLFFFLLFQVKKFTQNELSYSCSSLLCFPLSFLRLNYCCFTVFINMCVSFALVFSSSLEFSLSLNY